MVRLPLPRRTAGRAGTGLLKVALFVFLAGTASVSASGETNLAREIRVGVVDEGMPPLLIIRNKAALGVSIDILRQLLGPDANLQTATFPDSSAAIEALCRGELDILPVVQGEPVPGACLKSSAPYFEGDTVVIGRTGDRSIADLQLDGKTVAVELDSPIERAARRRYPNARIIGFKTVSDGLGAVASGQADAYINLRPIAEYALQQSGLPGLTEAGSYREKGTAIAFGLSRENPVLLHQIDERLQAMPPSVREATMARWIVSGVLRQATPPRMTLTLDEQSYLRSLPPLRVALYNGIAPLSYVDNDGKLVGIAADYVTYLSTALGISFDRRSSSTITEARQQLASGELDMVALVVPNSPTLRGVPVSRPYLELPLVVVGRTSAPTVNGLSDLAGKRIAVTDGGGVALIISALVPNVQLVAVQTIRDGMESVAAQRADLYASSLASAMFALQHEYGGRLRIAGSVGDVRLRFALALNPELGKRLMPLIDRAIAALSERERLDIQNRYFSTTYVFQASLLEIGKKVAPFGLSLLLVLGVLWRSVLVLRREVREREFAQTQLIELTRNLPVTVFQAGVKGGRSSIEWISGNIEDLFGVQVSDVLGQPQPFKKLIHPDDEAGFRAAAREAIETTQPIDHVFRVKKGHQFIWTRIYAAPRRTENDGARWYGYCHDVTEARSKSIALADAKDAAESASRAKDAFLATMSHEIRTPMSGVLGLIEILEKSRLQPEQTAMVGMIHNSGSALLRILDDILDFSKIEAARLTLEQEPFDLREVCDVVMGLLASRAHSKDLTMRCRVDRRVAASFLGDGLRLRQVLFNLIGNATKFTSSGGVTLRASVKADDGERQWVCMEVEDTGIGIEESAIPTLFSPFVQAESSTARRFGGSGLGLVISRRLIELMGGTLTMQSKPGVGTTISVDLALAVHTKDYGNPFDSGMQAMVLLRDAEAAASIADGLSILGIRTVESVQQAGAGARLVFVDDGEPVSTQLGETIVIKATGRTYPAGYHLGEDEILLSMNPFSSRALRAVCQAAIEGRGALVPGADEAVQMSLEAPTRDEALHSGTLILVAEDNPVNRHLLENQLRVLGWTCDVAEDGIQALAAYDACQYAILLTDCQMPRMNGYELATNIRARERAINNGQHLPIVGVTASIESGEWHRCLAAGMDECMRKPAKLQALSALLSKWMPGSGLDKSGDDQLPALDWGTLKDCFGPQVESDKLLEIIVGALRDDTAALVKLLIQPDGVKLGQWLHHVTGSASVLRYAPLLEALSEFRTVVLQNDGPQIQASGNLLLAKLNRIAARMKDQ